MSIRQYGQYCAIARSLDIIGERWTLLIIRELLTGPKRFKNLLQNLPGIGTNLLANRLKQLEISDIIAKIRLPSPADVLAYDLTDHGRGLEDILISIIQWGSLYLERGQGEDYARPGWAILGIKGLFKPEKAQGISLTCQFNVDQESFWIKIHENKISALEGKIDGSDITLNMDESTFLGLGDGSTNIEHALSSGQIEIDGSLETLMIMLSTLTS
ncbi:MAG: HTH-type transcriptional regulator YodB [Candidatus Heimdallarchaeota archaeon LC_2]|nr:MAG: HTH-type transcriptional regulator YodB [Candidatus Heimdallarchaeota archaeon LC_2]